MVAVVRWICHVFFVQANQAKDWPRFLSLVKLLLLNWSDSGCWPYSPSTCVTDVDVNFLCWYSQSLSKVVFIGNIGEIVWTDTVIQCFWHCCIRCVLRRCHQKVECAGGGTGQPQASREESKVETGKSKEGGRTSELSSERSGIERGSILRDPGSKTSQEDGKQ